MTKLTFEQKVKNKLGLHARPAAVLVKATSAFKSEILIRKNDMEVNAKSILGVMMLAAECGASLMISVSGEDAQDAEDALSTVISLFENSFGEDDAQLEEQPTEQQG